MWLLSLVQQQQSQGGSSIPLLSFSAVISLLPAATAYGALRGKVNATAARLKVVDEKISSGDKEVRDETRRQYESLERKLDDVNSQLGDVREKLATLSGAFAASTRNQGGST